MDLISLDYTDLRLKTAEKLKRYLALSNNNHLTIGIYHHGKSYIFGSENETQLRYDIGSITKTVTAHLILKLHYEGQLNLDQTVDRYLPLKKGKYPTIYQLLTHTAGYHHLTPVEITLPRLLLHSYARRNPYENCTVKTVIRCLQRRRFVKPPQRYGYSDFPSAILAVIAQTVTGTSFSTLFEHFVNNDLGMTNTVLQLPAEKRNPKPVKGKRFLPFWLWKRDNPYIAGGGLISNIGDVLHYLALQIESDVPYISSAHTVCEKSRLKHSNHLMCIGWHTYQKSNQLWHVGGVGTFRSSILFNKERKLAVAVLGNAKGKASTNAHYIAKMLYSELKNKRIRGLRG